MNNTDSRPKLVAGSAEGLSGHVDGKPREARMNHPRSITIDDKGNIYVADTLNMAIRKISEAGKFKGLSQIPNHASSCDNLYKGS